LRLRLTPLLLTLLVAAVASASWAVMEYRRFVETPLSLPDEGALFTVNSGATVRTIARELEREGYLSEGVYLRLLARWTGQASKIQAGEYFLSRGTTPPALLNQMEAGKVTAYSLTLIEGWTFRQLMEAIRAQDALAQTLQGLSGEQIMARLGHPDQHPEGRFLPETYQFPRGTTDLEFLRRAHRGMQQLLSEAWAGRAKGLPLSSPDEALILASIVEKETGLASERPRIAGVFTRRLKHGMRLQTDPTVIYGLGEAFDGNLRRRHLVTDTPYNTYTRKGLPPTPICLPGPAAIQAALHPADGRSMYFVARGDGSHEFSATLEQHNRAVRKYQIRR
jgi:UPF0755 protein